MPDGPCEVADPLAGCMVLLYRGQEDHTALMLHSP